MINDTFRFRVSSSRYLSSVTGLVSKDAFDHADHAAIAARASCEDFGVSYVAPKHDGELPSFAVSIGCAPKDPELVLQTVAARLESAYDDVGGEEIVR